MNEELLAQLREMLLKQRPDATATPPSPRPMTIGPAPSPASQARPLPEQSGMMGAIRRSAEPSPDTPAGWANEMFNPIRAGAQAREFAGKAVNAAQGGNLGRAAGMGAMAAMSVPVGPSRAVRAVDEIEMAAQKSAMQNLSVAPTARPYFRVPDALMGYGRSPKAFDESKYPFEATVLVRWPGQPPMVEKMRGLNLEHSLERARRNWEGADVLPYQSPLPQNTSAWDPR